MTIVSAVWSVMLRLLHIVSSSLLPLASTIRRWKRSLCSTTAWTSSRSGRGHRVDLGLEGARVLAQCGVAIRAANSSSAPRSS